MVQVAVCRDELHSDVSALAGFSLVLWCIEQYVFLPQVLGNLGEGPEQLYFLRREEYLTTRFLAKPPQFSVVRVFYRPRGCPRKILGADAEDRYVVPLRHFNCVPERPFARGIFPV